MICPNNGAIQWSEYEALRSLLTAGVLATGLLWATAASATPQMAQCRGRWVVTQRSADKAC